MKFLKSAGLILLISAMHLQAQTGSLSEEVTSLKANVKEVQTEDDNYKQQIESPGLGVIKYTVDEVDSKGRITNYSYEFNLADLDPYAVRQETDGDLLLVTMTVANKQSLVKLTEDGESDGFDDEVELRATDIENARQLIAIIKKAIPLAKEAVENKLNLNGYAQMRDWLAANIKDVRVDETTYQQNLKPGEYPGSIVYMRTEAEGGDAEEMKYHFNLGDINHNSLRFDISGDEIGVTFKTMAEQDLIRVFENNVPDGFTDEVMIMTSNVESARDLRTVLGLAIPEAKKLTTNDLPSLNDTEAALASMAEFVAEVNYGDMQMIQKVAPECVTTFKITEQEADDSEMMEYKLNLMDLNANNLKYEVSGGKMHFELRTMDKIKLIKEYENGVFQGYTDDFKIYAEDIEVARRLRHALAKAIAMCKESYEPAYPDDVTGTVQWMVDNAPDVTVEETTWKQNLERVEPGNDTKIKYTRTEVDDKGGEEEIFEFLLTDINPRSLSYEIGGNELRISFATNFEAEIIKHYKNGEIQKYAKEVEMVFGDVEMARNFLGALNKVIESLSEE